MVFKTKQRNWLKILQIKLIITIIQDNRTEWSPIRSVTTQAINQIKSDDHVAGVRFVNHSIVISNSNWTERSTIQGVIGRVISNNEHDYP